MSPSDQAPLPSPRILSSQKQVAALLDKPQAWFPKNRAKLEQEGFPPFDNLLEGWDVDAINLWIDRRSRIERHGVAIISTPASMPEKQANTALNRPERPKVYTVKMAAARLGFSADTVYGLINREELGCTRRPNCAIRIKEEHIQAYEAKFEQQAQPPQTRTCDKEKKADAISRAASTAKMKALASRMRNKNPKPQN